MAKMFKATGAILNSLKMVTVIQPIKKWYLKYEELYIPYWTGGLQEHKSAITTTDSIVISYDVEYAEDAYNSIYFDVHRPPMTTYHKLARAYWDEKGIGLHMDEIEKELQKQIEIQLQKIK